MADTITEKENSQPEKKSVSAPEPPPSSSRRCIVIGVILVLVLGAAFFYWRSTFTEDTDDAQVDRNLYQVTSRITGHLVKVYVDDNQTVEYGEALADVDPTDYQVALDQSGGRPCQRAGAIYAGQHQRADYEHHRRDQCQHFGLGCERGRRIRWRSRRSR